MTEENWPLVLSKKLSAHMTQPNQSSSYGIGKVHNLETWFQAIEINGNMANGVARVDSRPCTPRKG